MPSFITDNLAAAVGVLRAALILVAAFWPNAFSPQQSAAIIGLAVASMALSGVTVKGTVPKTPSAAATSASIQEPQPPQ